MPIAPLPSSTIRAIGSSLVLNDACSVVKELVDNALDADATSIIIEISSNTLEVIQVKDNGRGIDTEDRQLVCKRGCTSKIRTMEDLEKLGGSSLGFRGEALASVAEMSEAVTLTTRVDGEIVGTTLKFGPDGTLQNSASASHAVGTTFRIEGFLHTLPVRKETAKKAAQKTTARIKRLLYSYAYARPFVRFALKVLKANNAKLNWSYGPSIGAVSLQDTTAKIAGQEVATHCELRFAALQHSMPLSAIQGLYSVNAVIVKSEADSSKVYNIGHYVSIDGRPINPARGVIKDIVKLYKLFYRAACGNANRKSSNADPFLCMHIRCPPGSYDVNIEPAKDDVLFSDPSKVMALAEKLFRGYYGDSASETPTGSRQSVKHQSTTAPDGQFDLLLARKASDTTKTSIGPLSKFSTQLPMNKGAPAEIPNVEPLRSAKDGLRSPASGPGPPSLFHLDGSPLQDMPANYSSSLGRSETHTNMYDIEDEDLLMVDSSSPTHQPCSQEVEENEVRSTQVTNPWSLAKLNTSGRLSICKPSFQAERNHTIQLVTPARDQNDRCRDMLPTVCSQQSVHQQPSLPSPVASSPTITPYQNPGPPPRRRAYNEQHNQNNDAVDLTQNLLTGPSMPRPTNTLDTWIQPRPSIMQLPSCKRPPISRKEDGIFGTTGRPDSEQQERNLDNSLSNRLAEPRDLSTDLSRTSNHLSKPFRSPFKRQSRASSRPVVQFESLNSPCIVAPPMTPPLGGRVPLPDQAPSSQRPLPGTGMENESISMAPPLSLTEGSFKMSQSPSTELVEILEFEHRKKAAVLHQRKSQSTRIFGGLHPAQFGLVQRNSNDASSLQTIPSQLQRKLPSLDLGEGHSNSARHFEQGDANSLGDETGSLMHRNSPHRNRYLAAKKRLEYDHPDLGIVRSEGHSRSEKVKTGDLVDEAEVRMGEDDPRAYLIHSSGLGQKTDSISGQSKTGLKIRRTKTAQLPLETIPMDATNHCLKVIISQPFTGTSSLAFMGRHQDRHDEYISSGENRFVRWSVNSREITSWENTLKDLISKGYKVNLPSGEIVAPGVTVMLTTAIQAHVDAYGL